MRKFDTETTVKNLGGGGRELCMLLPFKTYYCPSENCLIYAKHRDTLALLPYLSYILNRPIILPVDVSYPFMPSGLFYLNSMDWSSSNIRGVWLVFIMTMFSRNSCI